MADGQRGLNAAQVALQRLGMDDRQLLMERALDAADRLLLSFFDEVVIPGVRYRLTTPGEVQYIAKAAIDEFMAIAQVWRQTYDA